MEEIKRHPRGALFPGAPAIVGPADPATAGKFTLMPGDVEAELKSVLAEVPSQGFTHRLSVRRDRDVMNSIGRNLNGIRTRITHNKAYLNPDDMTAQGIRGGDWVRIESEHGAIRVLAEADPALRSRVVSISHAFGGLPDDEDYLKDGVSTNLLISLKTHRETINAMPRMSAIPVTVTRAN